MADNVTLNPGVGGAVAATDDVGGVHYQKVKLDVGGDGLSVPVTGALPVSADALPLPTGAASEVTLAALNAKVTAVNTGAVVGTVTANAGTNLNTSALALEAGGNLADIKTAVQMLDNCIAGSEAQVDVVSSALPTGAATEVTLSALNTKVTAVNTGAVTVAASALPTGAATEATLSALNGKVTAVNTGAVTVAASALPTGASTAALQGGGLPAALGAGGGLKIDGSGTALPISGTITSIAAGANLIGDVAIGNRASGGATPYSYISDGTDFVSVTDGATTLYAISCTSTDATVVYIKFYNKATAPDPSAETPVLRFAVPSAATGAGFVWNVPQGMDFPTGLGFALVTGAADTDETAVSANEVMVNLVYKH